MAKCPFRINAVPPYNAVTDGGCHIDGTETRDHLQASITAAVAAGKRLYLPAGTYHIHVTGGQNYSLLLPSELYMYGDGDTSLITSDAAYPIRAINKQNITLKDFKLQGDYSVAEIGVHMSGACTNILIDGLTVIDMADTGIYHADALINSVIKNCEVSHCGNFGIHFKDGSSYVTVQDCVCSGFAGLDYAPHAFYPKNASNLTFLRCTGSVACYSASSAGAGGMQITGCNNVAITDCDMFDNWDGVHNDGYGYISNGTGNHTYLRCVGEGNYSDYTFYEAYYTGTASYTDCVGTKRVYP